MTVKRVKKNEPRAPEGIKEAKVQKPEASTKDEKKTTIVKNTVTGT